MEILWWLVAIVLMAVGPDRDGACLWFRAPSLSWPPPFFIR